MEVIIVGSGVAGLASAYALVQRGHCVTVVDRREGPGLETSYANGTLLTASMPEPWNTPGCWRVLAGSMGRADAPLQLRLSALPSLATWGAGFLRNSRPENFARNTLANLRLSLHSMREIEALRQLTGIEFGRTTRGALRIFRELRPFERAASAAERLAREGLQYRALSRVETIALEPALEPIGRQLVGALHYPQDETGDALKFCTALAEWLKGRGVRFAFGTRVEGLEHRRRAITALLTDRGRFTAERYGIAAGSYTPMLLKRLVARVPVRPAKGYSVTFGAAGKDTPLTVPLLDDAMHAAVVPLAGGVRVAGTAEFAGFDLNLPPVRIANLIRLLRQVLPRGAWDSAAARAWCGLRAMSMDGVPIIGPTPIPNVFINTGHGHLGWTQAAGAGRLMAELISRNLQLS